MLLEEVIQTKIKEFTRQVNEIDEHFAKRSKEISDSTSDMEKDRLRRSREFRQDYNIELKVKLETLQKVLDYIKEIDESENYTNKEADSDQKLLTEDWIEEHSKSFYDGFVSTEYIKLQDLKDANLIGKIAVRKPIIPTFVANWIEEKAETPFLHSFDYRAHIVSDYFRYAGQKKILEYAPEEVVNWVTIENLKDFMIAVITGKYEIDREPKYYVRFPISNGKELELYERNGKLSTKGTDIGILGGREQFTEQEIKAIDERYWPFRKLAEENIND